MKHVCLSDANVSILIDREWHECQTLVKRISRAFHFFTVIPALYDMRSISVWIWVTLCAHDLRMNSVMFDTSLLSFDVAGVLYVIVNEIQATVLSLERYFRVTKSRCLVLHAAKRWHPLITMADLERVEPEITSCQMNGFIYVYAYTYYDMYYIILNTHMRLRQFI